MRKSFALIVFVWLLSACGETWEDRKMRLLEEIAAKQAQACMCLDWQQMARASGWVPSDTHFVRTATTTTTSTASMLDIQPKVK